MGFVTSTGSTEFFYLDLACSSLFVLCGAIVLAFALRTLKMNNIAHGAILFSKSLFDNFVNTA